jgi:hypothetical protein
MKKKMKLEDCPVDENGYRILEDSLFGMEYEKIKIESFGDWAAEYLPGWIYRIPYRIADFFRGVKYLFQKIFRPYHASDLDMWNLDSHLSKIILPKLKAFKKFNKASYPSDFSEWDDETGCMGMTKEEYDAKIASGEMIGGGPDKWIEILDEMIFAFEYHLEADHGIGESPKFYKKWGLKDPWEKIEENMEWHWDFKKENGRHMSCGPTTLEEIKRLESEGWIVVGKQKSYFNSEMQKEHIKRARKGMEYFGRFFHSLWD